MIIDIKKLYKSYSNKENFVLSDISFSLKEGEICAIVGASGSGKTTLLRLIAGLESPTKGEIWIQEQKVSSPTHMLPPQKRNVGMVFQNLALFPHFTVEQNIAFGIKGNASPIVDRLLKIIKLEDYHKRYPHELSGGEQQRVAIARTLAVEPKVLLLDEPFSSLDASLKQELRREIQQIIKTVGISSIFITHDIQDAIDIADRIIFIHNGSIIEQGAILEVLQAPKTDYVEKIVANLLANAQAHVKLIRP